MSDIEIQTSSIVTESILDKISSQLGETTTEKLERIRKQMKNLPSVLDYDTLSKLRDGEYDISLKEYTTMSTYNSMMTAMYGNNSASPFQQYLNNILENDNDKLSDAKSFVEKMKENGLSNSSAVKLYSALKSYSLISSLKNYNFVNAKV